MERGSPFWLLTESIQQWLFFEYGGEFVKFLKRANILQEKNKVLLLMDLHKSHLFNYDFMKMMRDNNVEVCGFRAHCNHLA